MMLHIIADHYGKESQLHQLMEECCELASEASHSARQGSLRINMISEIADVEIMIEQIIYLYGIDRDDITDVKLEKLIRQWNRILREKSKEKKTNENN